MIITEKVSVKITPSKLDYYLNLGYDVSKKIIDIKVDHLTKGSSLEILAECDFCKSQKKIPYKKYLINISNCGKFSCSKKCASNKSKDNYLKKYGVISYLSTDEGKEKVKRTNLERYGSEHTFTSDKIKQKIKQTNLKKYGVENPFASEKIKDKIKETNLSKYGFENPMQNAEIKNKSIKTNMDLYGDTNPSKNIDIKNKIQKTNLEKYGFKSSLMNDKIKEKSKKSNIERYGSEHPLQNKELLSKMKSTNLQRYGVDVYFKSDKFKSKSKETFLKNYGSDHLFKSESYRISNFKISNHPNCIQYVGNQISLFKCDNGKDHAFEIDKDNYFRRNGDDSTLCTVCFPIGEQSSIKEKDLLEYIKSIYMGDVICNYRDELEIDIYIPNLKIGFEFNGLYWHSSDFKESNYHLLKTKIFKERGIRIIHIWEDDWKHKKDILKSQISNWLKVTETKIYARKCEVREVDSKTCRKFLDENHIQGFVGSKIKIGLYHTNELVSVMIFSDVEARNKMNSGEWCLSRFCNLTNTNVIGSASKLLNHFIKTYSPTRIVSYADNSWSNGNLYRKLKFTLVSESGPDYKYIIDGVRKNKQNFTKSKLIKLGYDPLKTESQIMESVSKKIYDCGMSKFELIPELLDSKEIEKPND